MLKAQNIQKHFGTLEVLRGIDLSVEPGELMALMGTSGAGKTTLLQILGTLEHPDGGELQFEGEHIGRWSRKQQATFRNTQLGFVFQFHHLLKEFNAQENVAMPALIAGRSKSDAMQRAQSLLARLGLGARLDHKPMAMSGGEQQRVAVARALMNQPKLILADEPTGNLDSKNGEALIQLFRELQQDEGVGFLIATHDHAVAEAADRVIRMQDGKVLNAS